jgi:UDP-glucose 4-epimerase
MLAGRPPIIYGDGLQSRDFTYVENVVHGNLLAAEVEGIGGRTFNVANGRTTNLLQLITALNKLLGTDIQPRHEPPRVGDVRESLADITRARETLNYEPQVDFEEGLRRSIDYYRRLTSD